jgi:glycosyltransferase involved in cell wall biosynthesis/sulfatase maturation enzyme AslB (radical SAM superfamily)
MTKSVSVECEITQTQYAEKPKTINLQANNICNSKCLMCNIWQQKKQIEINPNELYKILSDSFFSEVESVGITGGEPTLSNNLYELYMALPEVLPNLKGASFITNGLLTEKAIDVYSRVNSQYLKKGLNFSGMVSIDGLGDIHNKVRGKKNAFEKTIKTLFGLIAKHIQVMACCTIVKENVYQVHDLLTWSKENKIYIRFRIAEFINRLYNDSLKLQIRNFDDYEIKHLVSFFHLLINEYEKDESIKATYNSILSILTGGNRTIECPYQNLQAINLDSEGNFSICAPKGKLHKIENDTSKVLKDNFEERMLIKTNHCKDCIHDYHSTYIPQIQSEVDGKDYYDELMHYKKVQPFIVDEAKIIENDLTNIKTILLVGWYGTETAGDIAILKGIIQEYLKINPELTFILFSLFPFYSKTTFKDLGKSVKILDYHGKQSYNAALESDMIVMAGGPLMDIPQTGMIAALFSFFYEQQKPRVIEGCGIGPLNVKTYKNNVIQIAKLASKINVRDSASRELLKQFGIKKEIIVRSDPSTTFIENLKLKNKGNKKVIRCFFRELTDEYPQGISSEMAFSNLVVFIHKILEWYSEYRIELLAMHYFPIGKDDREFAKRIVKTINDNRVTYDVKPRTPEEILNAMVSASFCVSMRFHSVVFASNVGCKFIAIDYTAGGKIKGFLKDTNQLSRIIYLNHLALLNKNKFDKMLNNKPMFDFTETKGIDNIEGLNIVHLTSVDNGGAGIAAYRLHINLLKDKINSTFLVLSKSKDDESIKKIEDLIEFGEQENIWLYQWNKCQAGANKYPNKPEGNEIFTDINSEIVLHNIYEIKKADIINLHWTAGLLDSYYMQLAFFNKPVVWTLHDMNAFTGGCHYSAGCDKYKYECGACPQLGSDDENDLSHQIWLKKYNTYKNINLTIVTPSKWLAECAAESSLFFNHPITVIPNGFPLEVFKPNSIKQFDIGLESFSKYRIILFGADYETNRKGFNYLVGALEILSKQVSDFKIVLGVFGYYPSNIRIPDSCIIINYGKVKDENELAGIYNSADVFVLPSLEDNLPNVVIEALACGLPVVGFNIGGLMEQVDHKVNGYLANAKDENDLAEGIKWVLSESNYLELKQNCRNKAVKEYSSETHVIKYSNLYKNILNDAERNTVPVEYVFNDLFNRTEELIQQNEYSKSKIILSFLLEMEPENLDYLNDLAVINILLKDYENAEQILKKILTIEPLNEVAIENLEYIKQDLLEI